MKAQPEQGLLDILWILKAVQRFAGVCLEANGGPDRSWSQHLTHHLSAFILGAKDACIGS